jgi:uncharacterized membrane protein (DUF485 family)
MLATYFGFVLLVAYRKPLLGELVTPGLSLGILLGALVILVAWVLTGIYVRWANVHYDSELARLATSSRRARASVTTNANTATSDGREAADARGEGER